MVNRRTMIQHHYEKCWSRVGIPRYWDRGPTHELPTHFCVLEFPPTPTREMWTYATCCMSQPSDGAQIELHIFAPKQAADHVELLYAIAHYHRNSKPIGLGDSVNFGRPWAQGSQCDHGLISLPYLDGPLLENVVAPEGNTVIRFLWLLPITRRELAYKKQFGLEALEQRLEVEQVNYLDPMRQSVV